MVVAITQYTSPPHHNAQIAKQTSEKHLTEPLTIDNLHASKQHHAEYYSIRYDINLVTGKRAVSTNAVIPNSVVPALQAAADRIGVAASAGGRADRILDLIGRGGAGGGGC